MSDTSFISGKGRVNRMAQNRSFTGVLRVSEQRDVKNGPAQLVNMFGAQSCSDLLTLYVHMFVFSNLDTNRKPSFFLFQGFCFVLLFCSMFSGHNRSQSQSKIVEKYRFQ